MDKLTVMPFVVAMLIAVARMPTNVYQICAWNAGTLRVDPWRTRSAAGLKQVAQGIRSWLASLWSPRVAFACLAVLLALMVAQHGASHDGLMLAIAPLAVPLEAKRTALLAEANALKDADGKFKDDATRAAFDAKMTEVETLAGQIRTIEAEAATANPADVAARAQGAADERARMTAIQTAVRTAVRTSPTLFVDATAEDAFARELVDSNVTLDQARARIFERLAASAAPDVNPRFSLGEDAKDKWVRGAGNWLLVKSGMADVVARHQKIEPSTFDPGEFRGMSLLDLGRHSLERAGRPVRGLDKIRLASEAMTYRATITQSTSDFAVLLENTLHKILQAAYAMQADTWRRFCNVGTVQDFRAHNRYRMGSFSALDVVGEDGEFKTKTIPDGEKGSITATTKGNIINVSRQMIVNDDMNSFARLPMLLGRAAALSIETDVYALLAQNSGDGPTMGDGIALFHATSHGANKTTGAALSAAAIDADRVAMASQRDVSSNEILDLRPVALVLPVGLGGVARVINQSQYDPDTVANKSQMKPNVVAGLFRDVVDTPRITGTRRYLFADPSIAPVLEVAFLDGQQAPVLETQDGWRVDGAEMKVRLDYGVAAVDFRGAVSNAGV